MIIVKLTVVGISCIGKVSIFAKLPVTDGYDFLRSPKLFIYIGKYVSISYTR